MAGVILQGLAAERQATALLQDWKPRSARYTARGLDNTSCALALTEIEQDRANCVTLSVYTTNTNA